MIRLPAFDRPVTDQFPLTRFRTNARRENGFHRLLYHAASDICDSWGPDSLPVKSDLVAVPRHSICLNVMRREFDAVGPKCDWILYLRQFAIDNVFPIGLLPWDPLQW